MKEVKPFAIRSRTRPTLEKASQFRDPFEVADDLMSRAPQNMLIWSQFRSKKSKAAGPGLRTTVFFFKSTSSIRLGSWRSWLSREGFTDFKELNSSATNVLIGEKKSTPKMKILVSDKLGSAVVEVIDGWKTTQDDFSFSRPSDEKAAVPNSKTRNSGNTSYEWKETLPTHNSKGVPIKRDTKPESPEPRRNSKGMPVDNHGMPIKKK